MSIADSTHRSWKWILSASLLKVCDQVHSLPLQRHCPPLPSKHPHLWTVLYWFHVRLHLPLSLHLLGSPPGLTPIFPTNKVPGHSPSHVPALLEGEGSSVVDPRPVDVPTDLLITLWCPTGDDPHSLRLANSGADEDYAPPPRPLQTDTFSDATMVVDTPTLPPPTIVVTSSDGSSAPGPPSVLDASVGDGVDTQMDTAA